jgi:hypothetical protein
MESTLDRWCSMKAMYLVLSRDTVFYWIVKRNMPATKIGRLEI